ncbi:MAG: type II toxin-antitoxin system RelE/ParE family toxin [Gammaproteobacteria bacterium]
MKYVFHPEALTELESAAIYYAEKQPGLELRIASVEASIQRIIERPESYAILEQDVRRCLTRVFPYAVLYTIEPDFVLQSCAAIKHPDIGGIGSRLRPKRVAGGV